MFSFISLNWYKFKITFVLRDFITKILIYFIDINIISKFGMQKYYTLDNIKIMLDKMYYMLV